MARQILGVLSGVGAMMVVLGKLRGKLALEMVDIERLGQIGELVPIRGGSFVIVPIDAEVQVKIVEVDEFSAGKVFSGRVHLEVLGSTPRLRSRAVHIVGAGPWAEGREKIGVAKMGGWGCAGLGPGCCVCFACASAQIRVWRGCSGLRLGRRSLQWILKRVSSGSGRGTAREEAGW